MNVYDDDQLLRRGLEKQMLHVTKQDVNLTATVVVVAKTIIVDLQFTSYTLAIEAGASVDIVKSDWLTIWGMLVSRFQANTISHTSNDTELVLLNYVFQFFLLLFPTDSVLSKVCYLLCNVLHSI